MEKQGVRLKELINKLGLTNKKFAEMLNVSPNYISILIKQPERISTKLIYNITKVVPNLNENWFLNGSGDPFFNENEIKKLEERALEIIKKDNSYYPEKDVRDTLLGCGYDGKKRILKYNEEILEKVNKLIEMLQKINNPTIDQLKEIKNGLDFKYQMETEIDFINRNWDS